MVWMYVSLTSSETEFLSRIYWPFVSLLFLKYLTAFIGLSAFTYWFVEILYVFLMTSLSVICIANVFSWCVVYHFYISTDTFWWAKCSPIYLFFPFLCLFKDIFASHKIMKICPYILKMYASEIHLEFIFVYVWDKGQDTCFSS